MDIELSFAPEWAPQQFFRRALVGAASRALYCAPLLALVPSARAQIVTENAGVSSPEVPTLRESFDVLDSENLEELRWTSQLIWALDTRHELKLTLPVVSRDVSFANGAAPMDADLSGLGDATLRYKQALWRRDDVMESERWSALAEVGAPTGSDDDVENGATIPADLRISAGDWTFGAGTAYTWIRDRNRFSAETFYRHRTAHDGVQLGSSADLDLAYWYRMRPSVFRPETNVTEVRGVIELLSSYHFASEVAGQDATDDGTLVWLAPGVQVFPQSSMLFEANVQLPVYQDLEDSLGDRHWGASLVLKFLF